jgi:hypothetical protein
MSSKLITEVADAIVECLHYTSPDDGLAKMAIVEPNAFMNEIGKRNVLSEEAEVWYIEFQENDTQNWSQWIKTHFGEEWGLIAENVAEEGY